MNNDIHTLLDQVSKLVNGLKENELDLSKVSELDESLDVLSNKIKTAWLEVESESSEKQLHHINQDAAIFFDENFNIIRFTGSIKNIFIGRGENTEPKLEEFFEAESFKLFKEKTDVLGHKNEPQFFTAKIISNNKIVLPVDVLLEKVKFGNGKEHFSAGLVFEETNPDDLKNYQEILIENLPDMDVYLFDTNYRHVLAGGREKERYNLTNSYFTGKTLFEVFDEKTQKRLYPFYKNALDGKTSEGEVRVNDQVYFVSASPVHDIKNEVAGGALIAQNVTKEKEVERNLIRAKREAEEADKAKSLFLANMSHEIRTPLNAIIGFTDLLNKTPLTSEQKKYSSLINQSSEHLLSVVNEILFLFKLNMGKVFVEQVPFNSHDLVRNVRESLFLKANEKNLAFNIYIDKNVPEVLIGDPFRIKQILINLVSNAVKFTDKGAVSINLFAEYVKKRKVFLRFEINDTGIGISQEDLNKIFDEFAQSELKTDKSRKGVGLGLTITKKLVDLLNGRLVVDSEINKGSVFTVIIPFQVPKRKESVLKEKKYDITYNLLENKKILYVDDDENNVLLAESILAEWKTDFKIAYNGTSAIEELKKEKFDAVLLDIHMPGMSGVEVVKQVRGDNTSVNQNTKMMAVTANILRSDLKKYMDSGFDDFILKPFREEEFYNKICRLLKIEITHDAKPVAQKKQKEQTEKRRDDFDTSMLLKNAGGDFNFFNKMIDTFSENAKVTVENMEKGLPHEKWKEIGEKAHKAIPSFRYFGLMNIVHDLAELENLTLHKKHYKHVPAIAKRVIKKINEIIHVAQSSKIPEEKK